MYVVLVKAPPTGEPEERPVWIELGQTKAPDGTTAIRAVSEAGVGGGPISGVFIAVPLRSFQTSTLRYEPSHKVIWGEDSEPASEPATPQEPAEEPVDASAETSYPAPPPQDV